LSSRGVKKKVLRALKKRVHSKLPESEQTGRGLTSFDREQNPLLDERPTWVRGVIKKWGIQKRLTSTGGRVIQTREKARIL